MYAGWHQVAFGRELEGEVMPAAIGRRRLVLVRRGDGLGAFDGTCPHRGAHLGHGGRLDEDVVVCPFHGHRVALGQPRGRFHVCGHPTLEVGGLVFVRLGEGHENGLGAFLERIASSHVFVPGFAFHAPIAPDWVIENVFDADHFKTVHELNRRPRMAVAQTPDGHLTVDAVFETPPTDLWREGDDGDGVVRTRFRARVFSPTLVATELGDAERPYVVITAATPDAGGECDVRVSVLVPFGAGGEAPERELTLALLRDSRTAFEQDLAVWAHVDTQAPTCLVPGDEPVVAYRRFCQRFGL